MKAKTIGEISLNEVRQIIASGAEFSCTVVEVSEERKKGGTIKHYIAAKLLTAELYQKYLTGRPMTPSEKETNGVANFDPSVKADNPKFVYGIRHILTGPTFNDIRTIRPLLITIFNNKKVIA
jgi:hypothetical protein